MRNIIIFFSILLLTSCVEENVQDSIIPNEVAHKKGYIKHLTPPNNFKAITGWITAIHDKKSTELSYILIDYIRVYARINSIDYLLSSNEYDDNVAEGGLYMRYPWFGNDNDKPMPYEFSDKDYLVLKTSLFADNVWHVWNKQWPRAEVPSNVERCWLEVRCKIFGSALIQLGLDYWKEPTSEYAGYNINNIESGVSDWYFKSNEWVILNYAKQ